VGVDSKQAIVHSLCSTAASVADKHRLPDLLHGEERKVWGDGAYQGQGEAIRKGRAQSPGHDLAADQIQADRGPSYNAERTALRPGCEPRWSILFVS
jgi:IS5 family transposase